MSAEWVAALVAAYSAVYGKDVAAAIVARLIERSGR